MTAALAYCRQRPPIATAAAGYPLRSWSRLVCGTARAGWLSAFGAVWARAQLGLQFGDAARRSARGAHVFATNMRLAAAVLAGGRRAALPVSREWPVDVALGALAVINMALVGVAFGAYGLPLLRRVAIHTAFELAAFSVAGSSYLAARDGRLTRSCLYTAAGLACVLLAAGALAETYVEIGGQS